MCVSFLKSVSIQIYSNKSRNTNVFEIWVSYPGRGLSSHLCGKRMVPQSPSSFKRALNKTEMYTPPPTKSLSTWRWSVFYFLNITPACMHTPRLWNVETFSEAVSILEKVPIMQRVYAQGGGGGFFPYPPSFHLLRGIGEQGNISHTASRFLHGQECARSWKKPGWYLHVAQTHNRWTVDKITEVGQDRQASLVLLPKRLVFSPFIKNHLTQKQSFILATVRQQRLLSRCA